MHNPLPFDQLGLMPDSNNVSPSLPFDMVQNEPNPDGSITFDLVDLQSEEEEKDFDFLNDPAVFENEELFYANLVEHMDQSDADMLASSLMNAINEDDSSRSEWTKNCEKILKYLGFKIEEDVRMPFENAAGIFDTTLSNALVGFYANARMELFPTAGPCTVEILGHSNYRKENAASRIELYLNTYLTKIDRLYLDDSSRLLMHTGLFGCCFRKVYFDPVLKLPVARTVLASDLIVNNDCASLLEASRITHVFKLSKKELLMRMNEGFYKKVLLSEIENEKDHTKNQADFAKKALENEGIRNTQRLEEELNKTYKVYECCVDLSDTDFKGRKDLNRRNPDVPKPYIVTLLDNKKILSIRRNFHLNDHHFKRIEQYVLYQYLPSFGLYGYGLGQIIGSNSIMVTKVLRQILNAETLKIFPRGIRQKGVEFSRNNFNIGPSEFVEIDTQDRPITEVLQFLDLPPQSNLLVDFLRDLREQTSKLAATCDVKITEGNYQAPVGTTLAMLEVQNKVTSVIIQSLHRSLSEELQMLYKLFAAGLQNPYGFNVPGMYVEIHPQDFDGLLNVVPSSNPEVSTFAQSIMKAESVLKMAQSAPEIHNLRAAFEHMYKAMKVDDIDKILPPPQQPDPNAPPPIDPNEVLKRDVEVKAENNRMRNEQETLKAQIALLKEQVNYLTNWQKIILEYQKAGLAPPHLPDVLMPNIPDPFAERAQEQQQQGQMQSQAQQEQSLQEEQDQMQQQQDMPQGQEVNNGDMSHVEGPAMPQEEDNNQLSSFQDNGMMNQ